MRKIFVSYKRGHAPSEQVLRKLQHELGADFELLYDQGMQPGVPWSRELYGWLLGCDAGIAIVSREAASADWCRREWSVLAARHQWAELLVLPLHVGGELVETRVLDEIQALPWSDDVIPRLREQLERLPERALSARDFLAAHQAWLRWQFKEARVLGQEPYALADVYIETECGELTWGHINQASADQRCDPFNEANGGRAPLVDAVLARMADPKFRELLVVQAGPGSGKSAFTVRLANELMDRGLTPILVRFRDLKLATFHDMAELLDDAIRIGPTDEESPHTSEPLVRTVLDSRHELGGTPLCRAVFILDGWDEVSLTGNVSYQAQLRDWLPKVREFFLRRGLPVRVVLTGRPSAEVGQSGVLLKDTPVLTMRPMQPQQLRGYASALAERLSAAERAGTGSSWQIDVGRLKPLFDDYEKWFKSFSGRPQRGQAHPRPAFASSVFSSSSAEVLGTPLLAYLGLRVAATSTQSPADLLSEPTALYHELIEATVKHAGKGHDAGLQSGVHRGGEPLRRLLQEVASTISILRAESVSFSELKDRFEDADVPVPRELIRGWIDAPNTENVLRELVINFYFKGGHNNLGCEFLHKSFREYLYAEAIFFALTDAGTDAPEEHATLKYWQDFRSGTAAFKLSRRLAYLLAPQWLSADVERHLYWLLRRAATREPERWTAIRDLVTEVYAWWAEGVHLRHQPSGSRRGPRWLPPLIHLVFEQTAPFDDPQASFAPVRSTALDAHLGHALLRIAAILHRALSGGDVPARGRRAQYQSLVGQKVHFRPGAGFFAALLARMDAGGWRPGLELFGLGNLGALDLRQEVLSFVRGMGVQLEGGLLEDANLIYAQLGAARLVGANLSNANLAHANFTSANLAGATLTGATLTGANLTRANLSGTNLAQAKLQGARVTRGALAQALNVDQAHGTPIEVDSAVDLQWFL